MTQAEAKQALQSLPQDTSRWGPSFGRGVNGDLYKVTEDSILFETLSTLVEIKKEDILAHKVLEVAGDAVVVLRIKSTAQVLLKTKVCPGPRR